MYTIWKFTVYTIWRQEYCKTETARLANKGNCTWVTETECVGTSYEIPGAFPQVMKHYIGIRVLACTRTFLAKETIHSTYMAASTQGLPRNAYYTSDRAYKDNSGGRDTHICKTQSTRNFVVNILLVMMQVHACQSLLVFGFYQFTRMYSTNVNKGQWTLTFVSEVITGSQREQA